MFKSNFEYFCIYNNLVSNSKINVSDISLRKKNKLVRWALFFAATSIASEMLVPKTMAVLVQRFHSEKHPIYVF